ncbi:hypothetical protein [Rhodococcoides fascians]|uniref:hypothetical protein n=1 Tax=Rhodococcoides fascians TaxID=1828 RepID=UPI001FC95553|nr:hypothetical protein [Rhodococcus fascians]
MNITPSLLYRLSGIAVVVAFVFNLIGGTLHPVVGGWAHSVEALSEPFNPYAQYLLLIGTLLQFLGLPALWGGGSPDHSSSINRSVDTTEPLARTSRASTARRPGPARSMSRSSRRARIGPSTPIVSVWVGTGLMSRKSTQPVPDGQLVRQPIRWP